MRARETVRDLMSRNIIAVLPGDTALDAARLMQEYNIGALPVVSAGEVRGMLTDRDIVMRCVAAGKNAYEAKVSDIMSTDVAFVTPNQPVRDAIRLMGSEQVRRLPVVRDGYIDGMISLADIVRRHQTPEVAEAISEISESHLGPAGAVPTK